MSERELGVGEFQVEVKQVQTDHLVSSAQMRHDPPITAVEEQVIREARKEAFEQGVTVVGEPFVVWRAECVWKGVVQPDDTSDEVWDHLISHYEDIIVEAIDRL